MDVWAGVVVSYLCGGQRIDFVVRDRLVVAIVDVVLGRNTMATVGVGVSRSRASCEGCRWSGSRADFVGEDIDPLALSDRVLPRLRTLAPVMVAKEWKLASSDCGFRLAAALDSCSVTSCSPSSSTCAAKPKSSVSISEKSVSSGVLNSREFGRNSTSVQISWASNVNHLLL